MKSTVLNVNDKDWQLFINQHSEATIYHHPAWINLISDCYNYSAFILAIIGKNGAILSGLPVMEVKSSITGKRWICLPFSDHCGILSTDQRHSDQLIRDLITLQDLKSIPKIEVRQKIPPANQVFYSGNSVLHLLELSPNSSSVFKRFIKPQTQRNIRKAEREGVDIQAGNSLKEIELFYDLHLLTRRRLGVPIQPKRYFNLLEELILKLGLGFILMAFHESVPIAAAVFLTFKHTLTYKYGASDHRYWNLRANNLLFWEAIKWGCDNGFTTFDWGKTDKQNIGLRRFKDSWGATEVPLVYSVIISGTQNMQSPSSQFVSMQGLAKYIIRSSPAWVCRLSGELFYRHFA